jgi:hypothetical protein
MWGSWWNENLQGKPKYSEKTRLNATLSTANPTCRDLGSNLDRRGVRRATVICFEDGKTKVKCKDIPVTGRGGP